MSTVEPVPRFVGTDAFAFFDYFRVPYSVVPSPTPGRELLAGLPVGALRLIRSGSTHRSPTLSWVVASGGAREGVDRRARYELGGATIVGQVVSDVRTASWRDEHGRGWMPLETISGDDGRRVASVWRDVEGNVLLPFDPAELMSTIWSEGYRSVGRSKMLSAVRTTAVRAYYETRPVLPRPVQIAMRRAFARAQRPPSFPAWPIEDCLHDLYDLLFDIVATWSGQPVPFLAPWPEGRSWALVLTHDVETAAGLDLVPTLRHLERLHDARSSWNLAGGRYLVDDAFVRDLQHEGCEVGVHGLHHDGRDLGSRRKMAARLPAMRRNAERWGAVGYRSPATQRVWEWMPQLGFGYDSSYPDTDPYEPQPGGCCSYLPFFDEHMVELPITLPQDHTLFSILGQTDGALWLDKARHVRDRGGMVLTLTHPDYATDPRVVLAYRELLAGYGNDPTAWHALPREVADWWRRRRDSSLTWEDGDWSIRGPARSQGRVASAGVPRAAVTAEVST